MEDRKFGAGSRPTVRRLTPIAANPKAGVPGSQDKPAGRHAAIRKVLPTLATYRAWSAKARTEWDEKKK